MNWHNWAGNVSANPTQYSEAECEEDLVGVVKSAAGNGGKIRPVGTGHSFTPLCATRDMLVSQSDNPACLVSETGEATFWAGSKIGTAAAALWELGYSFQNQGDIDVQSLGGALGTGTHGTSTKFGSFSSKVKSLRLVTSTGDVLAINNESDTGLMRATSLSVGLLGLLSEVKLDVVPNYYLIEKTEILDTEICMSTFDQVCDKHRNAEFYWLPKFDRCVLKTLDNSDSDNIITTSAESLAPPGTIERYLTPTRAGNAYLIYRNIRTIPFLEMEYAVPLAQGMKCLGEIRTLMTTRYPEKTWVVEFRTQAGDQCLLSPANGQEVATISVHEKPGADNNEEYFRACEKIFLAYDGRPHWGKLCFLSPQKRADLFPGFEQFSKIRRRLDPNGMFLNDYLRPLFE